jgi:DNA-binding NarL/FixJ family response regulator
VEGGEARLREAVETLDGSLARLELARALAALGETADDPLALTAALGLAQECGAVTLTAELRAAGAAGAGPATLTSIEREVAALAAEGHDATAIAQALFLTPKAASDHLAAASRKLDPNGPEAPAVAL